MLYVLIYLGLSLSKVVKVSVDLYGTYFAKFILKCSSFHVIINDMCGALYETLPFSYCTRLDLHITMLSCHG